jgi:large subunit ribosomal protein L21
MVHREAKSLASRSLSVLVFQCYSESSSSNVVKPTIFKQQNRVWFSSGTVMEDDYDDDEPPMGGGLAGQTPKFAVVYHAAEYAKAMRGLHGQQIAIAQLEGEGKDDPDFDPFLEEELEEARLIAEAEAKEREEKEQSEASSKKAELKSNTDDEKSADDAAEADETPEAEIDPSSPKYQYKLFRQKYRNDGSLKRNKSELAILRAGAPSGGKLAVIALAGTQYKVTMDDVLIVNLLKPVSRFAVGAIITLRDAEVLLLSSTGLTLVGMPYVPGGEVDVMVEESTMDAKVIIFKKRRRKNSQRKQGFRRDVTMLRVLGIRFPEPYDSHYHMERPEPAPIVPKVMRKLV